ncbi:MAG: response regulator [Myxococcales bacterium]|nr:response regulator [Myxococcales bacterium]
MSERLGRVLIVDDSEDDQFQLRRLLRREFDVTAAFTGAEALERLERASFDVLITDQKMPRMSGDALIARIKENPRTAALRCILLSGRTSDEQLVEILRGGRMYHYFEKHKSLLSEDGRTELTLAVRSAVQASRLEQERERLTARLRAQVDAISGQYRLLRSLANLKDPAAALRLVVESLVNRLPCRGAIGLMDLRPNQGVFGHAALAENGALTALELFAWREWVRKSYAHLSGRDPGEVPFTSRPEPFAGSAEARIPHEVAAIPVFINRDLRGLLVLARDSSAPLEADEQELFGIWRDQLQDALTRMHTQMLDELRRIELMVEAMTEGVVLTDEEGAVTLMNPSARRMLSIAEFERPDFAVVVAALGLSSLDVLRHLGAGDRAAWRELRRGETYCQVLFSRVRDHAGHSVGILTVIRDVTAEKHAEQRREEFVHILGHELRSPLTSIGGVVDLLAKGVVGPLQPRQRDYLAMAKDSAVRLNQLVSDLLDLAKFEQGKMPLAMKEVDLAAVVRDAVRSFEPLALKKGVSLAFECMLDGLACHADPDRLAQVLSNLLTNAFKFTLAGGRVRVTVFSAFAAPDLYLVAVHNTGAEIPEGDLDRIFDKYEQAGLSPTGGQRGTGLGLSICRSIIEGHRGAIWVESGRGQGTTFLFSLPASSFDPGTAPPGGGGEVAGPAGEPVLIICNDEMEAYAVKAVLLGAGFRVRVCPPELTAVRAEIGRRPPLLALCLDLEGNPSRAVLSELVSRRLPIVAMVPFGTPPPPAVDLMLEVPGDIGMLGSTLNVILARRRERRRLRVLIVDREAAWASALAGRLDEADYLAYIAADTATARTRTDRLLPDLVIIDRALPGAEAFATHLSARRDPEIPVLHTDSQAEGDPAEASAGLLPRALDADDLLFIVRSHLAHERRTSADSLSVLPGARELQREIQGRVRDQQPFACGVVDLEGLHGAIQHRGFMWGHEAMNQTAQLIHQVLREHADDRAFLGHQSDEGFVFVVAASHCEAVCQEIPRAFERVRPVLDDTGGDATWLQVRVAAVVDDNGRFSGFPAVQAQLATVRGRAGSELVTIDRG